MASDRELSSSQGSPVPSTSNCVDRQPQQQFEIVRSNNSSNSTFKSKSSQLFDVFILSEAGKPIHSYSKREDAVTLMPLCSTLINFARRTQNETLHSIKTSDNLIINFRIRSPLVVIVIHEFNCFIDVDVLVDQMEAQIASILTKKTLNNLFAERPTYDFKRLLHGGEKLLDSMINNLFRCSLREWPSVEACLTVNSTSKQSSPSDKLNNCDIRQSMPHRMQVPVLPMATAARDQFNNVLSSVIEPYEKIVFSLVFKLFDSHTRSCSSLISTDISECSSKQSDIKFSLITLCNHHASHKMTPPDIQVIMAVLNGSKSQLSSAESWVPISLLRFNPDAFLHSYISYINDSEHCLILLTVDRDQFGTCQYLTSIIEEKFELIINNTNLRGKIDYRMSPLVHPVLLKYQLDLDMSSRSDATQVQQKAQIFNSKFELFHARQLQFVWYQNNKYMLEWQRSAKCYPKRAFFFTIRRMIITGLSTLWLNISNDIIVLGIRKQNYQVYCQFDPTISTNEATEVVKLILNWIKKEDENFCVGKDYR